MNTLKILFKNKITIIVAVVLAVTLLISATVTSTLAKYTKSQKVSLDLSVKSGFPVLLKGYDEEGDDPYFREQLGLLLMENDTASAFTDWGAALDAITTLNIVYDSELDGSEGNPLVTQTNKITESGKVDVYWDSSAGTLTISSSKPIYANQIGQRLFRGTDTVLADKVTKTYGLSKLQNVNLTNLNTSNTATFTEYFQGCSALTSFNFKDLETGKATSMAGMFANCSKLATVDLSTIDTTAVSSFENMFQNCSSLTSLDLTSFDNKTADSYDYMFSGCSKLGNIVFGDTFFTTDSDDFRFMFQNCSSLTQLDLTKFAMSSTEGSHLMAMFKGCSGLTSLDLSNFSTAKTTTFNAMFQGCSSLNEIIFGDNFTTESGTKFQYMFDGCSSLKSIDGIKLHLNKTTGDNNVTEAVGLLAMFNGCTVLESITFETPYQGGGNVRSFANMFTNCAALTTLDLTGFATDEFYNLSYMFSGCTNLTEIKCVDDEDTAKFSTANAQQVVGMFNGCAALKDVNKDFEFDLSSVKKVSTQLYGSTADMFNGCVTLTEINFSKGFTSNIVSGVENGVMNITRMFNGCTGLTELDLTTFDFTGVTSYNNFFGDHTSNPLTVQKPAAEKWKPELERTGTGLTFNDYAG